MTHTPARFPAKEPPVSTITIDTPYLQIAEHSRDTPNYHAQDAVKDYYGKPAKFLVFADIYFRQPAQKQEARNNETGVVIELTQIHRQIATKLVDSWDLYPFRDAQTSKEQVGKHVELACDAASIDASVLKIEVTTPDGQDYVVTFDLSQIK